MPSCSIRSSVSRNPAYGSWISALAKDYMTMSPEAREEFYAKTLTE